MKTPNPQRYLLADDFDERSKDLSMRRSSWTVISSITQLQLDGSFQEFCADISLSENEANSVITELLSNRLIYENPAATEESAMVFKPISDLLKGTFSTLALGMFGEAAGSQQSKTILTSSTSVKLRLGDYKGTKKSPTAVQNWIWDSGEQPSFAARQAASNSLIDSKDSNLQGSSVSQSKGTHSPLPPVLSNSAKKSSTKRYKLQPIISQIEKLSTGGVEGSVLVYQVFLKVPTELLRSEGIESLKLVDANTEFSSQKLCQAIVRATTQITGYNLKIVGYNR